MHACYVSFSSPRWGAIAALVLVLLAGLFAPHAALAATTKVGTPQQLMALGKSQTSGQASNQQCDDKFDGQLQAKKDACVALGGNCYCRYAARYPIYQKYYPASETYVTSRVATFSCWIVTLPDTCAPCVPLP